MLVVKIAAYAMPATYLVENECALFNRVVHKLYFNEKKFRIVLRQYRIYKYPRICKREAQRSEVLPGNESFKFHWPPGKRHFIPIVIDMVYSYHLSRISQDAHL